GEVLGLERVLLYEIQQFSSFRDETKIDTNARRPPREDAAQALVRPLSSHAPAGPQQSIAQCADASGAAPSPGLDDIRQAALPLAPSLALALALPRSKTPVFGFLLPIVNTCIHVWSSGHQ